jgi:hypothetical protein
MDNHLRRKFSFTFLKVLIILFLLGSLPLYVFLSSNHNERLMREQGENTECVMVAYGEGRTGVRGPKKGFFNQFEYQIGYTIHQCYVFTSVKPLPIGLKLKVRYLQTKDGKVRINFPDEYKETYKEYGFNDYGY